jgi:signal transduction histidine kinase
VLRVSDFGPGIDHDSLPHVFERFYRADIAYTRAGGGSGLGLAIVAALAEAHAGSATVSSEPGEGATFTITLPLAKIESGDGAAGSPGDADVEPGSDAGRVRTLRNAVSPQGFLNLGR